jgi:hypothetical protein
MFDPQSSLLSGLLAEVVAELAADPAGSGPWIKAEQAIAPSREAEVELARIVDARDFAALRDRVASWAAGDAMLPEPDRQLLRRALKAFRKSLKVTRLDEESSLGGRGMTAGRHSGVVGITPPGAFPRAVWDQLVKQGRLKGGRNGIYELPPE